jgi:hypothetical protein
MKIPNTGRLFPLESQTEQSIVSGIVRCTLILLLCYGVDLITSTVANLPEPPVNYGFTREQTMEIERFFHEKRYLKSPNLRLDLYRATIVAIRNYQSYCWWTSCTSTLFSCIQVPINASNALRRLVEALFIMRTETRLNTDGHLKYIFCCEPQEKISFHSEQWCQNLVHRAR